MSIVRAIVEKELRDLLGSRKFAVISGLCGVLVVLSFYLGAQNYRTAHARYEAAVRENLRQLEGLTDWLSVRNHRIFLPPQPMEALVTGVSSSIGRTVEIFGRGELAPEGSRFNEEPLYALFHILDLEFLLRIVFPLFAILFAYDAISGEKERGTLRLTFAHSVPRDQYILGKIAGAYLALASPLLLAVLAGCLLLLLMGVALTGDEWLRLGLILCTAFLYLGAFLALSVCVSALTHRSSSSFVILLLLWIGMVLIVPRAAVMLAGRAVDVPSLDEVMTKKNRYSADLWKNDRDQMIGFKPAPAPPEQMLREFESFMGQLAEAREQKMQAFARQLNMERANRQEVQQRLALGLARISPAAAFSLAVSTLAGTSPRLTGHFLNAATAYQQQYAAFMQKKTGMVPGGRMMRFIRNVEDGMPPKPIDAGELPVFQYTPMGVMDLLPDSLLDMGLLSLFTLFFFLGAYLAFLRYDVR
jgi:ABC-type transport system involved in multi-copper enzyme maturation permease subunit